VSDANGARREAHPENRVALEHARMTARAKRVTADLIARWRKEHPEATCSDAVALRLAEMAASVGRL
jgi:hypothetical protein